MKDKHLVHLASKSSQISKMFYGENMAHIYVKPPPDTAHFNSQNMQSTNAGLKNKSLTF